MKAGPKILVIQTAFLGDVILTLPVVQNIKQFMPGAEVDFMCIPQTEEVLKNNPLLKNLIVYDKRGNKKISRLIEMISGVKSRKYDIIISPHRSLRSALITHFSGAKQRIGFNKNVLSSLLTGRVVYNRNAHEIERNLDLVRAIPQLNFDEEEKILKPELFPAESDEIYARQFLGGARSVISFAPCSKWFTKQLPENKSVEIAAALIARGYDVILIGGNDDKAYCDRIEIALSGKNLSNLCGKLTPLQSKIVIGKSECLISVDSAAAHIGASTDTPVIQIYGSTVPAFGFYPLSSESAVIENDILTCRPCTNHGRKNCPLKHFKCMEDLDVNKVLGAVERLRKNNQNSSI